MLKPNLTLKASSLVNSIFICLMISIFCGCLVIASHYQNLLFHRYEIQEKLINQNTSAFNFALSKFSTQPYNEIIEVDLFEDRITSLIEKRKWGFNDILICKTIFGEDTLIKAKLIGSYDKTEKMALYVTDYDKILKVSGKTEILGNIIIPKGRIEQTYINGKLSNSIKLTGSKAISRNKLPKLYKKPKFELDEALRLTNFQESDQVLINNFSNTTKIIEIPQQKEAVKLNFVGNYILKSNSSLIISEKSILKDVLIIAPEVYFKSGFKGNVHVIAQRKVNLEKEVALKYPSSIYMNSENDLAVVEVGSKSSILGNIIITGQTHEGSRHRKLFIAQEAIIMGSVYCYGATELKGKIIGSLYTDRFYLKTESSEYENVIQNGSIDGLSLSSNFISAPLFIKDETKVKYAIIKEF